jgi:ribonucleotide reductase alpha subunit
MNASIELQKQLLIGVIRGDGCAYSQGLQVGLSNKQLIYQLFDISLRLKLSPTINVQKYNDGIRQDVYTIYFPRSANYDFIMEVGKDVHKVNYTSKTYAYGIWKDDNYFTKIKSVKIINSIDDNIVYDLQIAGDESFVVSGLSVHNCALLDCDDSTLSISANNQATAMLTAASSGIGLNVGRMRSIGSSIRNGTVIHPGIVPFLKIFESTGKAFSQAARGGKLTCYYHIFGYEIETVIQLKNNRANEVSSVKHLDYCICISELFYKRFINNQNITLFCNSDTPGLYDAFGTPAFDKLYEYYEKKDGVRKKVVSMQKLFVDLMEQRSETARIYIMNVDHANTHSPYLDGVYMSNLCVAPETLLLTNKGYLPIGTLEDQSVTIWNGWEWSDTVVRKTGIDQKLINIKFQDDKGNIHNIECTEYHKFFIQSRNDVIEVRANDLIVGQYIQNWNPPEFLIDSDITLHQYHRDWWVYSTHNIERLSDTYCLTEPKRNRMVINGILSGQCVEIIQPSHPISDINDTGIHEHTVAVKNNKLDEFIKLSQDNEFLEFPI